MGSKRLQSKITQLLVTAIVAITVVVSIFVWNHTSESIRSQLIDRLNLSYNMVLEQLYGVKVRYLQNAISVSQNQRLIDAIKANNYEEIEQLHSDLMLRTNVTTIELFSSTGVKLYSTEAGYTAESPSIGYKYQLDEATTNGNFLELRTLNNENFLTVYLPYVDDDKTQILGLTYNAGRTFLTELKMKALADITILPLRKDDELMSTLPDSFMNKENVEATLLSESTNFFWKFDAIVGSQAYFSQRFPSLLNNSDETHVTFITINSDSVKSAFLKMQIPLLLFAMFAAVAGILWGKFIAKNISRPLEEFSSYSRKVANGDYTQTLKLQSAFVEILSVEKDFNSMLQNMKEREQQIIESTRIDPLTGLNTRTHIKSILQSEYINVREFQAVAINVFGFRGINDVFGYDCGDVILTTLADRVRNLKGIAARMSGGEILWIPETIKSKTSLELIKVSLEQKLECQNITIPFSLTMGYINCDNRILDSEDLYRRLNTVLGEASLQRQGLIEYDDNVEEKYKRHHSIVTNLKKALFEDADELTLVYQPKIHLASNTVCQAEALIRWNNAELGFVAPDEFIGIAEQAGFIGLVTRWVLRRAVRDVTLFKSEGLLLNIAVNISPEDLMDDTFIPYVTNLLTENLIDHRALSFEITESIIVEQPDEAIKRIQKLKDVGFKLAIDDFGTGYSSLAYLTQLPVDLIKIDRSFVQNLSSNHQNQAICKTVIELANKFNLDVVAEGIEDEGSMELLRDWGCQWGQGYHINRPVKFREFLDWHSSLNNKNKVV